MKPLRFSEDNEDHEGKFRKQSASKKCKILSAIFVIVIAVLVCVILVITLRNNSSSDVTEHRTEPWRTNIRLPKTVIPLSYRVSLDTNLDRGTFKGYSEADIQAVVDTKEVVLHINKMNVTSITLQGDNGDIEIKERTEYKPFHFYVLKLQTNLLAGKQYKIKSNYTGLIPNNSLNGFYISYYKTKEDQKEEIASTFLHPVSAREILPCFDEPQLKANFTLSITHDYAYTAIANTKAVLEESLPAGRVNTVFEPTVKMSSYLLCFALSKYTYREQSTTIDGRYIRLRVYVNTDNIQYAIYALQVASFLLPYFKNFYQVSYPLNKLDLLAVPSASAAMENWGLITFPKNRLLVTPTSGELQKQAVLRVVSHELAHQWFGNLVTMKWWDDSWLNEGFASFISYQGGDFIDPSMNFMDKILPEMVLPALQLDAYSSSHPISTSANTPDEIREIFDKITYNKGSCVVQILNEYLGDQDFRKGLTMYLTKYAYGNAAQDDLWEQLSLASGKDVKAIMDTWTLQLGYPVVHVERINDSFVQVRQGRFSLDPPGVEPPKSPFNYKWQVPITYKSITSKNKTDGVYLLTSTEATFRIPSQSIINADHAIFYRVNYDSKDLEIIGETLQKNHEIFSVSDRIGLISDLFNLMAANHLKLAQAFDITSYVKNESNYYVWQTMTSELQEIPMLKESSQTGQLFREYVANLTRNEVARLGWDHHKDVNDELQQAKLLTVACQNGNDDVGKKGLSLYREWMNGSLAEVSPGVLQAIHYCGIVYGSVKEWEYMWNKQLKSSPADQNAMLHTLASSHDMNLINRLLNHSLKDINPQTSPYLIADIAKGRFEARLAAWDFVKSNWDTIFNRYGRQLFLLGRMLTGVLSGFSTQDQLNDIENFISSVKDLGTGKQAVKESIQKIKANIARREKYDRELLQWLKQRASLAG